MGLMNWVGIAAIAFLVTQPAVAQRRGVSVSPQQQRGVYGGQGPRGMYGGVSTGQMVGVINDPGFASRLGATVSGLPQTTTRIPVQRSTYGGFGGYYGGGTPGRGGGRGDHGRTNTVVVPWGVPVMYGGYGGGYDYNIVPQPAQTVVQPIVQPAPSVVINQYYTPEKGSDPEMRDYSDLPKPIRPPRTEVQGAEGRVTVVPPAERREQPEVVRESALQAATRPTITRLQFRDSGTVAEVIAYWRQGDQLHYISSDYEKQVVPLESLDRPATEQLNKEGNIEFRIEEIR